MTRPALTVVIGSSLEKTFIYLHGTSPVDLTGWGAVFRLRDESDRVVATVSDSSSARGTVTITPGSGQLVVTIPAQHVNYTATSGSYELELTRGGVVHRIIDGTVTYRQYGRRARDNLVTLIKQTHLSEVVEMAEISQVVVADRGPPGSPGAAGSPGDTGESGAGTGVTVNTSAAVTTSLFTRSGIPRSASWEQTFYLTITALGFVRKFSLTQSGTSDAGGTQTLNPTLVDRGDSIQIGRYDLVASTDSLTLQGIPRATPTKWDVIALPLVVR